MRLKDELVSNMKNFIKSADLLFENKDYTSSCILYFKALFLAFDYILLTTGKGIPKSHTDRFNKLKKSFIKFYIDLQELYPIYRTTYKISVKRRKCERVREYVKKLIKEFRIS